MAGYTPETPRASLEINLPAFLTEKCKGAAASLIAEGKTDTFAVQQTAALEACDGNRALLVYAIQQHNAYSAALAADRERLYCLATKGWRLWRQC